MSSPTFSRRLLAVAALMALLTSSATSGDSSPTPPPPSVETRWAGITFEVVQVIRFAENRLLVTIRIVSSKTTPLGGIFLGTPGPPLPAHPTIYDESSGRYNAKPFTLRGSTMTLEQTGEQSPMLPPLEPPGMALLGNATMAIMHPGQMEYLSIQFAAPPPPPPPPVGQPPAKQTLSFLLPNAKGPILHVPLPPP